MFIDTLLSLHPRNHWPIFCLQVWAVRSRSVDTRRQLRHGPQHPGHSSSSHPLYRPPLATGTPPTAPQSSSPLPESHELDPGSPGRGPPPLPCPRGARRQPASATYKLWCQLGNVNSVCYLLRRPLAELTSGTGSRRSNMTRILGPWLVEISTNHGPKIRVKILRILVHQWRT